MQEPGSRLQETSPTGRLCRGELAPGPPASVCAGSAPPTPCAAPPQRCPGAREGAAQPCQRPGLRTSFRETQPAEKYWGRGGDGGVCLLGRVCNMEIKTVEDVERIVEKKIV